MPVQRNKRNWLWWCNVVARKNVLKRAQKDIVFAREITENLQTFYIPGQYDVRLEPHGQIINDRLVLHFHSNEFVMIKH